MFAFIFLMIRRPPRSPLLSLHDALPILLKADEADGGPAWPDARIAEAFAAGITTVECVRQRFVEEGFASALSPYRGGTRRSEEHTSELQSREYLVCRLLLEIRRLVTHLL